MKRSNETYLRTGFAEVYFDGSLLRVFMKPQEKICVELIREHFRQVTELTQKKRVAVFFDTGAASPVTISYEVMRYVADNEYNPFFTARAVVYKGFVLRSLAKLFNRTFTPTLLTEGFENEADAMKWLEPYIPKGG